MATEPEALRRGKAFHQKIQKDWETNAQGSITCEKTVRKPNGRKGRIDVHALEDDGTQSAVLEAKASDWDVMTDQAVRRNVRWQIRQVWTYIEAELASGRDVCPGIAFYKMPKDKRRLELIEEMFFAEGIAVVWDDESREDCRKRNARRDEGTRGESNS